MAYGSYTNGNTTVVNQGPYNRAQTTSYVTTAGITAVRQTANSRRPLRPYSLLTKLSAAATGTNVRCTIVGPAWVDTLGGGGGNQISTYIGEETPTVATTAADVTVLPLSLPASPDQAFIDAQYIPYSPLYINFDYYLTATGAKANGYWATAAASPASDSTIFTTSANVNTTVTDGLYYVFQYIQSPSAPTITSVTSPVTAGQEPKIVVTWTAPTDNGGLAIAGYDIYTDADVYLATVSGTTLTKTFLFSDPDPTITALFTGDMGSKVGFKVRAYNAMNQDVSSYYGDAYTDGTNSAIVYVAPQAPASSPRDVISLQTPVSSGAFTLNLGTPRFAGGSAITGYNVSAQKYSDSSLTTAVGSPVVFNPTVTTTAVRTNLLPNPGFGYGTTGWAWGGAVNGGILLWNPAGEANNASSYIRGGWGTATVQCDFSETFSAVTSDYITVSASTSYTALGHILYYGTDGVADTAKITISSYTSANVYLGSATQTITIDTSKSSPAYWHPLIVSYTTPATGVKVTVTISANGALGGMAYAEIDNVLLETTSTFNTYGGAYFDGNSCLPSAPGISAGTFRTWPAASALPTGWLWCDGSYANKDVYANLDTVISGLYGADVGTTFKLPSMNSGTVKYIIASDDYVTDPYETKTPYSTGWTGTPFASTSTASVSNVTAQLTGLSPNSWYQVTSYAKNTYTTTSTATPPGQALDAGFTAGIPDAVVSNTVTPSSTSTGTINVAWQLSQIQKDLNMNNVTMGGQITSFKIYNSSNVLVGTQSVTDLSLTSYVFSLGGLNNGDNYSYYVVPVNVLGSGTSSSTQTATAPGSSPAPTSVVATVDTKAAGRVAITWAQPATGRDTLTGYRIKYTYNGVTQYFKLKKVNKFVADFTNLGSATTFELYTSNTYTDNAAAYSQDLASYRATATTTPVTTSTVPHAVAVAINNLTNAAFSGNHVVTDKEATALYFTSPISGTIPEANIVSGFGGVTNVTNTSLTENNPYTISTTGPTATSFSYTTADTLSITPDTVVSGGTTHNVTDDYFNGPRVIATEPNVGASTVRLSIATTGTTMAARTASGTVKNLSITDFNGTVVVASTPTENTLTYTAPGSPADVAETESSGTITDNTNEDIFNGEYTVLSVPTHRTFTYTPTTTSTTNIDKAILAPYGTTTKSESAAEVEVKYRSGWIG